MSEGTNQRRRVAVVTGSRAEFGLLRPVMHAVREHPGLELAVIAAGSHLVSPAETYRDVKREFGDHIADAIPMQVAGRSGRLEDAEALGTGVSRFTRSFARLRPDWIVVLGDRIEAFAAAAAASVGGFALAHIHGGDRAEGVADEAMRHAITKLAHLHLVATEQSAARIRRMGERAEHVVVVGSPAIDGLDAIKPLRDAKWEELGRPEFVVLMHPVGRTADEEDRTASAVLGAIGGKRVVVLHPNFDAGREGTLGAIERAAAHAPDLVRVVRHLARDEFVALLRRLGESGGVLVGNSSAALIEAGALRVPAVDIGPRQESRERATNVVRAADESTAAIRAAIDAARSIDRASIAHPFGDGHAGRRIAALLAATNPLDPVLLRKRWAD
ncbi:MAG: UDP-N-acetylglucosamine 2-epimerase [Phycisphaerales bacterium]